jgi:hypothetical protein
VPKLLVPLHGQGRYSELPVLEVLYLTGICMLVFC